ncbi:MAG: low affinity iron permease family protein [Gammaproteobacteria bacterium]
MNNDPVDFKNMIIQAAQPYVEKLRDTAYWNSRFDRFARSWSRLTGKALAFNIAILVILAWIISGPLFGFSDTWQLIINTATTIVTFLMVFLIQHTQNRDTDALQVKIDELIRAIEGANDELLDLEEMEEVELALLRKQYVELARLSRQRKAKSKSQ